MLTSVFSKLAKIYEKHGMDLSKAIEVWGRVGYSPENIQEQIMDDVGYGVSLRIAQELYSLAKEKTDALARPDRRPEGRGKLVPKVFKDTRRPEMIKFTTTVSNNLIKVGENIYQHKKTKKYWTLRESVDKNGRKGLFLVAIEVE